MTPAELIEARENLRLTQEGMANILGVSRRTMIRWEQGETSIPGMVDLAIMAINTRRSQMAGNHYPLAADVLRVMDEEGVDQETAIRSFGVEP